MIFKFLFAYFLICTMHVLCYSAAAQPEKYSPDAADSIGTFGYDLRFLQQQDDNLIILKTGGNAQVIVSAKYQAKVFTSTASGSEGISFGWVNYKAFSAPEDAHMNAYGGENRLWLGPEGGRFSLYFKPGAAMEYANWKTPAPFDTESWAVTNKSEDAVMLQKDMQLTNYKGATLYLQVNRAIRILGKDEINNTLGITPDTAVKIVAYQTDNALTNTGKTAWTETTGMPCLWVLDMLKTTPATVTVVPLKPAAGAAFSKVATTDYFGQIPDARLKHDDTKLFFKEDGRSRGKLGIKPAYAKGVLGSYDAQTNVLTIVMFKPDSAGKYLNQEWNTVKPVFSGDAVNAYNDGPLPDGTQMGPFYEIESVSPAAFLQPAQTLSHRHTVYHFTGAESALDAIAKKLLGVSVNEIEKAF